MKMMFLSEAELIELTGYQRMADQRRWLNARDWRFEQSRIGRPIVSRAYADQKLGFTTGQVATQRKAWTPNIAAIR